MDRQEQIKPKRKVSVIIFISMIAAGIIFTVIGGIWLKYSGTKKYFEKESYDKTFDGAKITKFDIKTGVGEIFIKPSQDENIYVNVQNTPKGYYTFKANGDKFEIKAEEFSWKRFFNFDFGNDSAPSLTILLPEKIYEKAELDSGVGTLNLSGLTCEKAIIDTGVGTCSLDNIIVKEYAKIDCGVGETNITNSTLTETTLDCGVGEFNFSGKLAGNLDADCGVGDINLDIDGYYDDYDIDSDDVNLTINKGSSVYNKNGDKYKIDINSGVGDIEISFR